MERLDANNALHVESMHVIQNARRAKRVMMYIAGASIAYSAATANRATRSQHRKNPEPKEFDEFVTRLRLLYNINYNLSTTVMKLFERESKKRVDYKRVVDNAAFLEKLSVAIHDQGGDREYLKNYIMALAKTDIFTNLEAIRENIAYEKGFPLCPENAYSMLGVKSRDSKDVRKAYIKLALEHHPDKGGDTETFRSINKAREALDHKHKEFYDAYLESCLFSRPLSLST